MRNVTRTVVALTMSIGAVVATSNNSFAQAGSRLNITGSANVGNQPGSGGANLLIDFLAGSPEPITPGTPTGNVTATQIINGVFSANGVTSGTQGVIQDLVTNGGTAAFIGQPIANFLTLGGYTFSLTGTSAGNAFGPISLFQVGNNTAATFSVNGFASGPGLVGNLTPYVGVFTAQFAGRTPAQVFSDINDNGSTLPVGFSAEITLGSTVPEPSTYMLLATGIGALGMIARRRRSQV